MCPPGHNCNAMGISDYTQYPCIAGKFCKQGTGRAGITPIDCYEGMYLDTTDGTSLASCKPCFAHHYCVAGAVYPLECPNNFYCSVNGTGSPCPPGAYCPFGTETPVPCPQTYYCAGNSSLPVLCQPGTYCPALSANPIACPFGYKGIIAADDSHSHLYSFHTACQQCEAGKYGTDPQRLVCYTGTPGYVFRAGAISARPLNVTTQGGYLCAPGTYCPPGSVAPLSCPVGTYNPEPGKGNFSDCISCAVGTYQYKEASSTCLKCSSSSTSLVCACSRRIYALVCTRVFSF